MKPELLEALARIRAAIEAAPTELHSALADLVAVEIELENLTEELAPFRLTDEQRTSEQTLFEAWAASQWANGQKPPESAFRGWMGRAHYARDQRQNWFDQGRQYAEMGQPTPAAFELYWAAEVKANGDVEIGAEYRHWALRGFKAANGKTEPGVKSWAVPGIDMRNGRKAYAVQQGFVISHNNTWLPGYYLSLEAAEDAFDFPVETLQRLQDEATERGADGISREALKAAR